MTVPFSKKNILGIDITDASEKEVLEYIVHFLKTGGKKLFITTPNPEILVYAKHHKPFADILNSADISLPDGVGVVVASVFLGKNLKNRVPGVDFMKNLCEKSLEQPITVGFLGGRPGVALKAAECLKREFPGLRILLSEGGNPDGETAEMIKDLRLKIKDLPAGKGGFRGIDILFVGFGFPKQEQWIYNHLDELPVRVAMTVGGGFDIFSGSLRRAPSLVREVGLEWLWRLILQPWRIKRQLALVEFIWLVFKERIKR